MLKASKRICTSIGNSFCDHSNAALQIKFDQKKADRRLGRNDSDFQDRLLVEGNLRTADWGKCLVFPQEAGFLPADRGPGAVTKLTRARKPD